MFNENDIYSHLVNGGNAKELYKILEIEINNAQNRIVKEKEAEQKEKERGEKILKARAHAFHSLKNYFSLVNPDITEEIINSVLDTLESVEIKISGVRDKRDGITAKEMKDIWDLYFPRPY